MDYEDDPRYEEFVLVGVPESESVDLMDGSSAEVLWFSWSDADDHLTYFLLFDGVPRFHCNAARLPMSIVMADVEPDPKYALDLADDDDDDDDDWTPPRQCVACGYWGLREQPRTIRKVPSYEVCPSCGFQPGVTDDQLGLDQDYWLRQWLDEGARWASSVIPCPPGWDPIEQLISGRRATRDRRTDELILEPDLVMVAPPVQWHALLHTGEVVEVLGHDHVVEGDRLVFVLRFVGAPTPELASFSIPARLVAEVREVGLAQRPGRADWDDYAATYHGELFDCPVCGWPALESAPRAVEGEAPHEICPSCDFLFGHDDVVAGHSFADWRAHWIVDGMRWSSRHFEPPAGWDPHEQLRNVARG